MSPAAPICPEGARRRDRHLPADHPLTLVANTEHVTAHFQIVTSFDARHDHRPREMNAMAVMVGGAQKTLTE